MKSNEMELRTPVTPVPSKGLILHDGGIMMFGSCFSDNIGSRLRNAMFNVDINPFGTTFNPASINQSIDRILNKTLTTDAELFEQNGVWNSFYYHSAFSSSDKENAKAEMNNRVEQAFDNLQGAKTLIFTLGTASIYVHKELNLIVNNCHKYPASHFSRIRMSADEVAEQFCNNISRILKLNESIKIIFTVSPIRHIADGIAENNLNKSILRVAIDKIIERYPKTCSYFPAYEIMMDDLRDYRFYAADMVHISDVAIDYIWEIFQQSYFTQSVIDIANKCTKISKRFTHRPMSNNQDVIAKFREDTTLVITNLINEYPYLDKINNLSYYELSN
ncbi:MAG: GSCFA domain-containing protein [Muribaculaceae bacterium]